MDRVTFVITCSGTDGRWKTGVEDGGRREEEGGLSS